MAQEYSEQIEGGEDLVNWELEKLANDLDLLVANLTGVVELGLAENFTKFAELNFLLFIKCSGETLTF